MTQSYLQSMTGFAGAEGRNGDTGWQWELRAVNGKGLDVRLRLPQGYERLEKDVRKMVAGQLKRGNLQITLSMDRDRGGAVPVINQEALEAVLKAADEVGSRISAKPPTIEGILALRGVLELAEPDISTEDHAAQDTSIMHGLGAALDALRQNRGAEGEALGRVLSENLNQIELLTKRAEDNPSRKPEAIRARLEEQVSRLIDASNSLDSDRLHQEAAYLATKADIREELDRLTAHVAAARTLLAGEGPVGRKLEFLAQEFNRESNTLCSKSNASEMTAIGLELKVIIDQFREQILNLE